MIKVLMLFFCLFFNIGCTMAFDVVKKIDKDGYIVATDIVSIAGDRSSFIGGVKTRSSYCSGSLSRGRLAYVRFVDQALYSFEKGIEDCCASNKLSKDADHYIKNKLLNDVFDIIKTKEVYNYIGNEKIKINKYLKVLEIVKK